MDLQTAILAVVTIAVSLSPFFISSLLSKRKANALLSKLQEAARSVGSSVQEHEACGNFIIGIDQSKKMLFFMRKGGELPQVQTINLDKVLQCKKVHEARTVKDGVSQYTVVDRVGLHFVFRDPSVLDVYLEFFKVEADIKPSGELQCMEKWHGIIKGKLSN
jgi:hypothetical protein